MSLSTAVGSAAIDCWCSYRTQPRCVWRGVRRERSDRAEMPPHPFQDGDTVRVKKHADLIMADLRKSAGGLGIFLEVFDDELLNVVDVKWTGKRQNKNKRLFVCDPNNPGERRGWVSTKWVLQGGAGAAQRLAGGGAGRPRKRVG